MTMTSAEYRALQNKKPSQTPANVLVTNPRTPEPTTTPPAPPALPEAKKTRLKHILTPTTLRPRYQVATHKDYEGARFVAVGLSEEQVQHMAAAARQAGIQEQN